jgi:hypothetical protein
VPAGFGWEILFLDAVIAGFIHAIENQKSDFVTQSPLLGQNRTPARRGTY